VSGWKLDILVKRIHVYNYLRMPTSRLLAGPRTLDAGRS
jgi:hypothetical protein